MLVEENKKKKNARRLHRFSAISQNKNRLFSKLVLFLSLSLSLSKSHLTSPRLTIQLSVPRLSFVSLKYSLTCASRSKKRQEHRNYFDRLVVGFSRKGLVIVNELFLPSTTRTSHDVDADPSAFSAEHV